jgi:uncharacterized protein YndB with AHSA1/START domain
MSTTQSTQADTAPVIVEKVYNAPVQKVWKAITDRDQMAQWYFDLKEFKPEVGFEFTFYGGDEKRQWEHHCRVTEVIPNSKLAYTWRYPGYTGDSLVTWELFDQNGKTKLVLTHTGLHTFNAEEAGFKKSDFVAGWTEFITVRLKDFVERS